MKFLEVSILLAALACVGCSNATGQPCESSPCPGGYTCVSTVDDVDRCLPECERRSNCNAPATCIPYSLPLGFCDEGNRQGREGDACLPQGGVNQLDFCGPGLECSAATRVCVPRCNAYLGHREDASCGAGFRCDSSYTWPEPRSVCFRECDPSVPNACGSLRLTCVRFQDSEGVFGICDTNSRYTTCATECLQTEVCVDDVCYPATSSPPLPWVQPELPDLID